MTNMILPSMRELIVPQNEDEWLALRLKDITSTDVAALFGISPYLTHFELWHRKKAGLNVKIAENERMKWGKRFEPAIAEGIAEDEGWTVRPMKEYIRMVDERIGASFDYSIQEGAPEVVDTGILEIKNVDSLAFKDGWLVDGDDVQAPPHIELQVQHQLLVSGRKKAAIGAMVGGNRVVLIRREPDPAVFAAIMERVAEFWQTIKEDGAPDPDFSKDANFISKLYNYAEPGKVFNATGHERISILMELYQAAAATESKIKKAKETAKAEILTIIGDAEKVIGEFGSIAAGVIGPAEIKAHTRAGYRNFKPYFKNKKEN